MKNTVLLLILLGVPHSAFAQTTWTQRPSNTTNDLHCIAYGMGGFVGGGATVSVTSPDGLTWSAFAFGSGIGPLFLDITYANGTYVGLSQSKIYTSLNGQTWTLRLTGGNVLNGIAYGNGILVVVGNNGEIRRSTDNGQTWSFGASPTSQTLNSVAYGNGTFVAVGEVGTTLNSTDGLSWTLRNTSFSQSYRGIAYGNGVFVGVGPSATAESTDNGQTWTEQLISGFYLRRVAYAGGTFVGVGFGGTIRTSTNAGQTWTLQTSGVNLELYGITYGNGKWVAVGANGGILTSPGSGSGPPPLVPTVNISTAIKLDWQSQDGAVYQVQSSTDLNIWQDTGLPIMGDGLPRTFFDATSGAAKKFYRIQIK